MQRFRRSFGLVALVCLIGLALEVRGVELARGGEAARGSVPPSAEAYQEGPLAARDADRSPQLPPGAEEVLGLSVLVAILYGFRLSGLARTGRATHAIRFPSFGKGLRARR